jgi:hypothetical protein
MAKKSQFLKRQEKAVEQQETPEAAEPVEAPASIELLAYDVFYNEAEKLYKIVTIKYDPVTLTASVQSVSKVGRQIGLVHEQNKKALRTLIRIPINERK